MYLLYDAYDDFSSSGIIPHGYTDSLEKAIKICNESNKKYKYPIPEDKLDSNPDEMSAGCFYMELKLLK